MGQKKRLALIKEIVHLIKTSAGIVASIVLEGRAARCDEQAINFSGQTMRRIAEIGDLRPALSPV